MLFLLNSDTPDSPGDAMEAVEVKLEGDGHVLLPTDVRRRLGLQAGVTLLLDVTGEGILLWTREMAAAGLSELASARVPLGTSLADELHRLRKGEANSLESGTRRRPPRSARGRG